MNALPPAVSDPETREAELKRHFKDRFGTKPTIIARAPGRVDLMGSHTDYNEGAVLTLAINREIWIAARPNSSELIQAASLAMGDKRSFSTNTATYRPAGQWIDYLRGVLVELAKEQFRIPGLDLLIQSTIPMGSGLSSSAALEVATAVMLNGISGHKLAAQQIALLCQRAENTFVGVKCGILDQLSSVHGGVLYLDCRNLATESVGLHPSIAVVVAHTLAPRKLAKSEYGDRRQQCEAGARAAATVDPTVHTLRDVPIEMWKSLQSQIDATLYRRGIFIIEEHQRVRKMAAAIEKADCHAIEALTRASFEGARDLFEIHVPAMSKLREAMLACPGVIGVRQAGAGFGGCLVAVIKADSAQSFTAELKHRYYENHAPIIYSVSAAPGAGTLPIYS